MRVESSKRAIIIGSIIFTLIVGVMMISFFSRYDVGGVFNTIANVRQIYIIISVGLMGCFILCEAANIGRVLKSLGYKSPLRQSINYSACGLFFSDITPSASGGQPMQLFFMHRNRIHFSHGMIALLAESLSYQIINCSLGILGFIYSQNLMGSISLTVKLVLIAGLAINLCALMLLLLLLFSPKGAMLLSKILNRIIRNENRRMRLSEQIEEYIAGAEYIKNNKSIIFKNLITSIAQFAAMYSIPYCVYLSVGLNSHSWLDLIMTQSLLNAGVAAIPLPGTVGIGESGFKILFADIFTGNTLMPGMILCRGISMYLGMIITGLMLITSVGFKRLKKY